MTAWTTPYYGVQHTAKDAAGRWCSINDNGEWAELKRWYPGCQFHPERTAHDSAAEARNIGERWLADHLQQV